MILPALRRPAFSGPFVAFATVALLWSGPVPSVLGGDILRGGAPAATPAQRAAVAARSNAEAAAAARSNARDNLARTTRAVNSVQAMQNAARAAASGNNAGMNPNLPGTRLPNVPNGLRPGGLEVDPGVAGGTAAWSGASLPTQSVSRGQTTVNIRQTRQTALLDWRTFNVGRQTTLNFNQRAAGGDVNKWVAYNRVNDPSAAPSQILGSIRAPGQVYVVNRNGIIFGAGSQVNAGTLVASSLPLNLNLVERGLLNNPDAQFLFSGIDIPAGAQGTPAFTPEPPNPAIGRYGDVIVQRGARIESPTNAAKSGGRVMLVGPNVRQAGSILAPDGQAILAAGMQVGIAAHPSSDPSLRGLDVYVGSVTPAGGGAPVGLVEQSGYVEAQRGNILLAGREIVNRGALESSTSVTLNGRIDILASYDAIPNPAYNPSSAASGAPFLPRETGVVRFAAGSVARVLPELRSRETIFGAELALRSQINVTGRAIHLGRDAAIQAPSGDIRIAAGIWRLFGLTSANPNARFVSSTGQVYLDQRALVDAAGTTGVAVSILQHILSFELRGAELADSPLQRGNSLRNVGIVVDARDRGVIGDRLWVGTPLADGTGFAGLVERTVGEFTAPGGRVTLSAGESVVMREGSKVDVSGGYLAYKGATIQTTRLVLRNRVVDLRDATPDRIYGGIYTGQASTTSQRWGVTRTYDQPLALLNRRHEPDYFQGAPGGRIDVTAPSMALDGEFVGRTFDGPRQRELPVDPASLRLAFLGQDNSYTTLPNFSPTPPSVTFQADSSLRPADPFKVDAAGLPSSLRPDRLRQVDLSPGLVGRNAFGRLTVENPDGAVRVPAGVSLDAGPGGLVRLTASNLTIDGRITAPGGTLSFSVANISLEKVNETNLTRVKPDPTPGRGNFVLGAGAVLSTAGLLVDDRPGSVRLPPVVKNGGTVLIEAFDVRLSEGSLVDVSGGARLGSNGGTTYGDAGSITIKSGDDLAIAEVFGGGLSLGGRLRGLSGAHGGALSLTALAFRVGGGDQGQTGVTYLDPGFFQRGGFSDFTLVGTGLAVPGSPDPVPGVEIAAGTRIRPLAASRLVLPNLPGAHASYRQIVKPEALRTPAQLVLQSTGLVDSFNSGIPIVRGDLVLGEGASILTDALGGVSLKGETVAVLGSVTAPGGSIVVAGAGEIPFASAPLATAYLGPRAVLNTRGRSVVLAGLNGWREGAVLPGGTVSVSGNIVAEAGSRIDVSGTRGVLDQPAAFRGIGAKPVTGFAGQRYVPVRYQTDGGEVSLAGSQMLYSDATLLGNGGGRAANGGSLHVSSGVFINPGTAFTSADENLVVVNRGKVIPVSSFARGAGLGVRDGSGATLPGIGNFSAHRFAEGGFASLSLGGNVRFRGEVSIDAASALRVASGGILYGDSRVALAAPYVALGSAFRPPALGADQVIRFTQTDANEVTTPYFFAPNGGTASLVVRARLIDVGDLSLDGFGRASLGAGRGDIRGNGTFQMRGDLSLAAGQIYPTTLTEFNLFAYDPVGATGSVSIAGGAARGIPLSAGGTLNILAGEIFHDGTLRAPIGAIKLGWDGTGAAPANPIAGNTATTPATSRLTLGSRSLTSVSGIDPRGGRPVLLPFGISFDGNTWIDPAGNDITVGGAPAKTVNLSATNVVSQAGSTIDLRGGDLYAYRWIQGNGGSRDILASDRLFAVIPGYGFDYAPYAPFNPSAAAAATLQGAAGYANSTLRPGDRVTLGGSDWLPAGTYTLLPARYALLPGAVLVTPLGGPPVGTKVLDSRTNLVSGYRSNDLDPGRVGRTELQRFEVAPSSIFRNRAEYADFYANAFLRQASTSRGFAVPRLPGDAGYVSFNASATMSLAGRILSNPLAGGRGALVDISSPGDILINRDGLGGAPGTLVLSSQLLNSFRAESLLVGGKRRFEEGAWRVAVSAENVTVDNAGAPLVGSDIVLAAKQSTTLADGAFVRGVGNGRADALVFGASAVLGSGDGSLLRASGSGNAPILRLGVGGSTLPNLIVGVGATVAGGSATLDSTYATSLDPSARLVAPVLSLHSGQISVTLDGPGPLHPTDGLVITGDSLRQIKGTTVDLTLLSYSSIDFYGTGEVGTRTLRRLALQAGALRGYNQGAGEVVLAADRILLDNSLGSIAGALPLGAADGRLRVDSRETVLGRGDLSVERFAEVEIGASSRLLVSGQGSLSADGDLLLSTPLLTGAAAARHRLSAAGELRLARPGGGGTSGSGGGLGAEISLEGASVLVASDLSFRSGEISLRARSGNLVVGAASIDVSGSSRTLRDLVRHTSGGTVNLAAEAGSVLLGAASTIDVSAPAGGGDAGFLRVEAPLGTFSLSGTILGSAGAGRRGGSFSLDAASISGDNTAATDLALNVGGFSAFRSYRVRSGDLEIGGTAVARDYRAYADAGSITVTGTIDASGLTGGSIDLQAHRNLVVAAGALLDASAQRFNAAGKGGSVYLGAGAARDGFVDPGAGLNLAGGTIDLSVAALAPDSASRGQFAGTLHLRAPQNAAQTDLALSAIGTNVTGASALVVEGFRLYNRSGAGGALDNALLATIKADGETFLGAAGAASANYASIIARLASLQPDLDPILVHGAEVYNPNGSLVLGSAASTEASDWNLATLRFGPRSAAGVLTLRARDNIDLFNAISDGFAGGPSLWLSPLVAHNPLLPANSQSWSYRFAAGADLAAADTRAVRGLDTLGPDQGMFRLGKNAGAATATGGANATTASVIANRFQVVRTGSGSIDIHAGRSFQLLNPFASVYTAGTQVATPNAVFAPNDFVTPILTGPIANGAALGAVQQTYPAQYAMAGGNVEIRAGENIERKTRNNDGLIDDASRQLPNNWLYRRGYVGPDGQFGQVQIGTGFITFTDPAASTSWWIDHSNFFQSVGALGGGNVTLVAGNEVRNVDAVIPTNARAPRGTPDASRLLELGGGDLLVRSGGDISGGVYYVERGVGRLEAGGSVTTNAARSPSPGILQNLNNPSAAQLDPQTWMPTTLFLGRSSFQVSARGDVLLGPMGNPFLLPQGVNNRFWYKTYFSTFGADASVTATSLGGDVTLRNAITLAQRASASGALRVWTETQNLLSTGPTGAAFVQPWLRVAETNLDPFNPLFQVRPPTLVATALSGTLNLAGNITLFPAPRGQLELVAAKQINAFQPTGRTSILVPNQIVQAWASTSINVSDANPANLPSATNPFSYFGLVGSSTNANNVTRIGFLEQVSRFFVDSGSTTGNFGAATTKQALHSADLLHRDDPNPLRVYALGGDVSGLTLFSPKPSRIFASRDLTDFSLYLQNLRPNDVTIVSAGRDIIPNNAASPLRSAAFAVGNFPASGQFPLAGDIHIGGPGSLQILAGRNLDLGTGFSNADGTGSGILSVGNIRNPFLPFGGADLFVGAGLGPADSLAQSRPEFDRFIRDYVRTKDGARRLAELGVRNFDALTDEQQAQVALDVFYLVLRDTGRNFNNPDSPGFQRYDEGFAAIRSLFAGRYQGDILTRSRNIRTQNGGDIALFAPGGALTLANTTIGNPLVPPGIVTESGGRVSIFTHRSVDIGIGRIFTLRGGDMMIWSSTGDIAAGVASKTVQAAPPTRVLIDPQSAAVETDLAGLATGGGIGVLASVVGVKPGNVDLIAPAGVIDAGDAGIRVTGNINLAATQVLNASNIAVGGTSAGAPATAVSAPNIGGLSAGAAAAGAASAAATEASQAARSTDGGPADVAPEALSPSVITVEVLGYGGGTREEEEREGQ
jgi:filamentous hemagglutinin